MKAATKIFILLFLFTPPAWAAVPYSFTEYGTFLDSEIKYLSSSANFTEKGGEFESLVGSQSFSHAQVKVNLAHYLSRSLLVATSARFGLSQSKAAGETRNNSDLTHVGLEAHWLYKTGWGWRIMPSFAFHQALVTVEPDTDEVMTSEGTSETSLGSFLEIPFYNFRTYLFAGVDWLTDGRADRANYAIGLYGLFFSKRYSLGIEAAGFEPISEDKDKKDPSDRFATIARVNAGSFHFYSTQPSVLDATLWMRLPISRSVACRFGVMQSLNGKFHSRSTAGFVAFKFGMGDSYTDGPSDLNEFEAEEPEYDESLFEPSKN